MKVKDLQQRLDKLNPDYEVICYEENESTVFLEIEDVRPVDAKIARSENGKVYIHFGSDPESKPYAIILLTKDV